MHHCPVIGFYDSIGQVLGKRRLHISADGKFAKRRFYTYGAQQQVAA